MRVAAVALLLIAGAASAAEPGGLWYRIVTSDGTPIGYASEAVTVTPEGREISDYQEIETDAPSDPAVGEALFKVRGPTRATTRSLRREDAAGRAIFLSVESQIGTLRTRDEARIAGGRATIRHTVGAESRMMTLDLLAAVRFDGGDALLSGWNPALQPRLEFDDFNLAAQSIDHVVIAPLPGGTGGTIFAQRSRYAGGALMSVQRIAIGPDGVMRESRQPMFGSDIILNLTSEAEATAPHGVFRTLAAVMVKSPVRIPDSALHSHIRFHFTFRDGIVYSIPETAEQRTSAGDGKAVVDVCADCGPGLPSDDTYLSAARQPTAWLQSDAPQISSIAARAGTHRYPTQALLMEALTRQTQQLLPRVDFVGHYSALDALKRRAGDCTESAALLAALGRASGIATKVVNGLVYSRVEYHGVSNTFMPHSWVLAYVDGHWQSFDAAYGQFDSTHIVLSINDGDARSAFAANQLAGLLVFGPIQEIRARPAP